MANDRVRRSSFYDVKVATAAAPRPSTTRSRT
ncbi:hypothetical protein ID867_14695 [Streptomyces parvulus]|nr:hypothetical protein [Streptomyces parvulus]